MMFRPGPSSIPTGRHPGGVVLHVYEVPSGRLLAVSMVNPDEEVGWRAEFDAERVLRVIAPGAVGFCLVAFDGDTGERFPPEAWNLPR